MRTKQTKDRWRQSEMLTKSIQAKTIARKCSKCKYYKQAKAGNPINPECQRHILLNNEQVCKTYSKKKGDDA